MDDVLAWSEKIRLPTYRIGEADRNPMFLEKRVYQGSSGVVYPHPVIDKVYDDLTDQTYQAVFLENRYLKIMILPEIGGRVQMALDKTNSYHFIYYNEVIKPALVGLAGPWISGGIEFNWPQHHRPSTFGRMQWKIEKNSDGSKTVWCAEIERMFRTQGMHGFRLYPDRAYLEINVQLYNRTAEPQSFLWWANPAVSAHDESQSVFPPDVHAVMDHGKRDVSSYPIATGIYYKVDYGANGIGTDISRYKNIPVPTSFMAYHSNYDFIGNYDHRAQAGMIHVANHHLVPGKKQWTWGNGDFGQAWDRQLTDSNGPYIELMCGAFTDNQPDFSWIAPGEEKRFSQIFMPYQRIGPAKNASKEVVVNLDVESSRVHFGVYVTWQRVVRILLISGSQVLFEKVTELTPDAPLIDEVILPSRYAMRDLTLRIFNGLNGQELLAFTPLPEEKPEIPKPASPAKPPQEIESNEELFLNGLHLEQYRHATFAPEPYYEEALRRDPGDSRCNNALGLLLFRRGKFADAETYFRRAIERLVLRNPNPYDGEPYYNLGLALKMQGRFFEAFDAFYKAVWNAAWQDAGFYELACLAARGGRFGEALDLAGESLRRNWSHHKARHLKIALLRLAGNVNESIHEAHIALENHAMEYGALWELGLLSGDPQFSQVVNGDANPCIELSLDYAQAGLYNDAIQILCSLPGDASRGDPMVQYILGWIYQQMGSPEQALEEFQSASRLPPDYCFPNRLEDILALEAALQKNPGDARAAYYLGNYWYSHRRYEEAISCWELSRDLHPSFSTVHRNLGLAYYNKRGEPQLALNSLERAFSLNPADSRVLFELDQLYKKLNRLPQERIAFLEKHLSLVNQRDDLYIEYVILHNLLGRPAEALVLLQKHRFHPWEGGEGKTTGQYITSLVELAKSCLAEGHPEMAVEYLYQAQKYPESLGEGKLFGAQENNIWYYLGKAFHLLGQAGRAQAAFERAAAGLSEPTSVMFYNDQPPEMIFYQGLAKLALNQVDDAQIIFQKLIVYGQSHLKDQVKIDYFAVSLPDFQVFEDDLSLRNRMHCHFMIGLGYLGLGNIIASREQFSLVLAMNPAHLGAVIHDRLAQTGA